MIQTIRIRSLVRVRRRLRLKYAWHRRRIGPHGRAFEDEFTRALEMQFLYGPERRPPNRLHSPV